MKVNVDVKTDRAKWESIVEKAADYAVEGLADQMMSDSLSFIPDDGESLLRDAGKIEKTGKGIRHLVWSLVYAGYQWFGVRKDGTHVVRNYTTPGTGTKWVDRAKARFKSAWDKVAQNGFTKGF